MENGNQPAYPQKKEFIDVDETGLTKREYFAAMAMQGILANASWNDGGNPKHVSESSVVFADELLKQLEL
jgi:hypothetical protein